MIQRSSSAFVRRLLLATLGIAGCNAILDNTPGELRQSASGQTPTSETFAACPTGQYLCHGTCVSADDPAYGCGDPSCAPCASGRGASACRAGACALGSCDPGYADCNRSLGDGCETDLSRVASCGACDSTCPADRPLCAPHDGGFGCVSGCPAEASDRCGDECVSTRTSVNHCGACNTACPVVANATVECKEAKCGFVCKAGFHACATACVVETDPSACGPTCVVCPAPANSTATCTANACGIACKAGFGDCNKNASDGCEAAFATDPRNCGGCGKVCDGGTCSGGVCSAAADGG